MRITGRDLPPPGCLASVRATRATGGARNALVQTFVTDEQDAKKLDWHRSLGRDEQLWVSTRDEAEVWTLGCPCGDDRATVVGVRDGDVFTDPIFYDCTGCRSRALIFDAALHGYNAAISTRKRKPTQAPNATFALRCPACKTTVWRPAVLVTYQGDNDAELVVPSQRLADRFDVLLVGGACVCCGVLALPEGAECA